MNEKEMIAHIKALTKIIEKQTAYNETLQRQFTALNRSISALNYRIAKLEGMKDAVAY